jgi:hypothetical protein
MGDALLGIGIKLGEGKIFELVLHLLHAHALGERGVDLQRLQRDAAALVDILDVVQRLHVVQAVGELDEQHADIGRHGQHQLAEILRMLGMVRLQLDAGELGDAVDEARHFLAEELLDLLQGRVRVLDRIVEQAGDDGSAVELHARQQLGDAQGMGEVGIARGPALGAMGLHGEDISAIQRVLIGRGIIGLYPLDQFELPNHAVTSNRPPRRGRIARRAAR